MGTDDGWTSPSDIADYVYCPRSHWYRHHPPPGAPSHAAERSALVGVRYHRRELTAERHRAERGGTYWLALLVGVLLAIGGAWWVFHL